MPAQKEDERLKLFADKEVGLWPDYKKLKCRFVYAIFEDERGYFSRARGFVLEGKEREVLGIVNKDVERFLDESKRGETRWEP